MYNYSTPQWLHNVYKFSLCKLAMIIILQDTPAAVSAVTNGIAESTASTINASISSGELQHIKKRLLETELRMKVFEQQVAEREMKR